MSSLCSIPQVNRFMEDVMLPMRSFGSFPISFVTTSISLSLPNCCFPEFSASVTPSV